MACNRSVGRAKVITGMRMMCSGQCLDGEAMQIEIPFIKSTQGKGSCYGLKVTARRRHS